MRRVLIITYYWPPSGGSGVQRWVKFSKYLPQTGWQPVIYTPSNPELTAVDATLEEDVPEDAEIIRRPIFEPYGIYRKLLRLFGKGGNGASKGSGEKGNRGGAGKGASKGLCEQGGGECSPKGSPAGAPAGEVNPINAQKKSLGQRLSLWIRGNFFIPDPRCFWVRPSVSFLKKYLEEHPVDVIVSTGPPHSMHLIARRLSLSTGIPWVADFRDPWTRMFYFKHLPLTALSRRKHRRLEKQVLDDATVVVAVSPLVQDEFKSMTSTPVELITNGFDEEDFETADEQMRALDEEPGEENRETFNIVHTGLFASDGNPLNLWSVLGELCEQDSEFRQKLRITLAGKTDTQIIESIKAAGLSEALRDKGYVSHEKAVRSQCAASVLILPLRQEPEYRATLPGKLFEYLASRRPVVGVGQTDGAMARILSESGAGATFEWEDRDGLKAEILRLWALFKEGKLADNPADIGRFSRRRLTREMADLFERISK